MKFCPYCGTEQADDSAAFCMECGKPLPEKAVQQQTDVGDSESKEKKKRKKQSNRKAGKARKGVEAQPLFTQDDGYDGYYDDVLPADLAQVSQTVDPQLIKRVVALAVGAILIIAACVAIMYLL